MAKFTILLLLVPLLAVTSGQRSFDYDDYDSNSGGFAIPTQAELRQLVGRGRAVPRGQQEDVRGSRDPEEPEEPVAILKQINEHNEDGSYTYGYEAADGSFKLETRYPDGLVQGKYGYIDENGEVRVIEYGADMMGFQPVGDLPEGIIIPPPVFNNFTDGEEQDQSNTGDSITDIGRAARPLDRDQAKNLRVEHRARGSSSSRPAARPARPVQALPPPPPRQQQIVREQQQQQQQREQPDQRRGQQQERPITPRPLPRAQPQRPQRPAAVRQQQVQQEQPAPSRFNSFSDDHGQSFTQSVRPASESARPRLSGVRNSQAARAPAARPSRPAARPAARAPEPDYDDDFSSFHSDPFQTNFEETPVRARPAQAPRPAPRPAQAPAPRRPLPPPPPPPSVFEQEPITPVRNAQPTRSRPAASSSARRPAARPTVAEQPRRSQQAAPARRPASSSSGRFSSFPAVGGAAPSSSSSTSVTSSVSSSRSRSRSRSRGSSSGRSSSAPASRTRPSVAQPASQPEEEDPISALRALTSSRGRSNPAPSRSAPARSQQQASPIRNSVRTSGSSSTSASKFASFPARDSGSSRSRPAPSRSQDQQQRFAPEPAVRQQQQQEPVRLRRPQQQQQVQSLPPRPQQQQVVQSLPPRPNQPRPRPIPQQQAPRQQVPVTQQAPLDFDRLLQEFTGRNARPAVPARFATPQQQGTPAFKPRSAPSAFNAIPAVPPSPVAQNQAGASFTLNTDFGK